MVFYVQKVFPWRQSTNFDDLNKYMQYTHTHTQNWCLWMKIVETLLGT